jgi:hypothetical protein
MSSRGPDVFLMVVGCLLLAGIAFAWGDADARTVYDHDLTVDSSTVLSGDTFEVRGNVTVNAPATLTLSNAVLELVGDANGSRTLLVAPGAFLVGDRSTVRGTPWTIAVELNGSSTLDDCVLEGVWGANGSHGVLVGGAATWSSVLVRQSPNGTGVKVTGSLSATDCTFEDLGDTIVHVTEPSMAGMASFTRCAFGPAAGTTGTAGVLYEMPSTVPMVFTLVVTDCTFEGAEFGVFARVNTTTATVTVTGTTFDNCGAGISVQGNKATVSVTHCVAAGLGGPAGFHFYSVSSTENPLSLTTHHLVVEGFQRGIYVQGPVHGFRPLLHHMNVTTCDQGIASMGSTVLVEDSNVSDCEWAFYAETKARIEVRRTVHEHGSGRNAPGEQAAVVAYSEVNVTSCRWKDAYAIIEGTLSLVGEDGMELERVDLADPMPREVVAWSVTKFNRLGRLWIIPTIVVDGEEFEGSNFSIYDTTPQDVEVVDHLPPDISSIWPEAGQWFATSDLAVGGHVEDRGSGLSGLTVRIAGGQQVDAVVAPDGNWTVEFDPVGDGTYVIELNATDVTGGHTNVTIAPLHVDTVDPVITLDNESVLVNIREVWISGTTEPGSTVNLQAVSIPPGHPFPHGDNLTADEGGAFSTVMHMPDGRWDVVLTATDRAGNTATATFEASVDTVAPTVVIDTPTHGEWLAGPPRLSGLVTDEGVSSELWAWFGDEPLDIRRTGGSFDVSLMPTQAPEGDLTLTVRAKDEAGNEVRASVTVHIDVTPPAITVDTPAELRFFTTELKIDLQGRLVEANLVEFTLNGYPTDLLEDIFTGSLAIGEGENTFILYARDQAGNEDEVTVVILRDITPPSYTFSASVPDGTTIEIDGELWCTYTGSGDPQVVFAFEVSEWSRVTGVGGTGTVEGEGILYLALDLSEGGNSFTFNIVDEADNRGDSATYEITLDTTPPEITLEGPKEGIRTKDPNHRILGRVEVGSTLTMDGGPVPVNADGTFNVQVDLEVGQNVFSFEAVDRVGLEGNLTVTITREKGSDDGPGMGAVATITALVGAGALSVCVARRRR